MSELNIKSLKELETKDFLKLVEPRTDGSRVVTLLMPTERKGAETRKNPIVFKNLLAEARGKLDESPELCSKLEDLRDLDSPLHPFWQCQDEGLALVVREHDGVDAVLLPFEVDHFVDVGEAPYLSPLLRLTVGARYHVLALALGGLRLYRASRWDLEEIALNHVPVNFNEAMKFDDPEESLQARVIFAADVPGAQGGVIAFHGHGITGDEVRKKKIRRFFEMVDTGLAKNFEDREMPLALMGTETEVGMYREANHYPHLSGKHIVLGARDLSETELRGIVCNWIAERDAEHRKQMIHDLENQLGPGSATTDFGEIVKAAETGRIATLFVQSNARRYGTCDLKADRVTMSEEPEPGARELVGSTATAAAATGARVYFTEADEKLPGNALLAAVFRY